MRLEHVRRTHWIAIALLVGTLAALIQGLGQGSVTPTQSAADFERLLYIPPIRGGDGIVYPRITDITIYPPIKAGFSMQGATGERELVKSIVRYRVLTRLHDRVYTYRPSITLVDHPYRPGGRPSSDPSLTLARRISEMSKTRDWLSCRYAWWVQPQYRYPIWIGACLLVIGIAWPTVQSRLINAGYGRPIEEEKPQKESFWEKWFSRAPATAAASKPLPTGILTEAEMARIEQMESELAGFAHAPKEPGGEVDDPQPEIRTLTATPLEPTAPPPAQQAAKEYGGEFYPTATHVRKKNSEEKAT